MARKRAKRLDLRWSPKRLKEFCETHAAWVLELGPRFTPSGLERLYWRHARAEDGHIDVIAGIAGDARTPEQVLRDIWARFRATDRDITRWLASNPAAPRFMLKQLQRARDPIVRERARATLKARRGIRRRVKRPRL